METMKQGMLVRDKISNLIGIIELVDGDLLEVKLLSGSYIIAHANNFRAFVPVKQK